MRERPLAYLITIRTYGTWLSGDLRGSVDARHNGFGEPFAPRDDFRSNYQRRHLKAHPWIIDGRSRSAIEGAIAELCDHRRWDLYALNVRTNHVHAVIASGLAPERVMGDLKAYSTRALRREGLVDPERPVWAAHGSTRWAWTEEQAERCVAYVLDSQGDDLPGSGWVRALKKWDADGSIPPGPDGPGY